MILKWDAYQAYENGEVVAWTHGSSEKPEDDSSPPYSMTKVINDLKESAPTSGTMAAKASEKDSIAMTFSLIALGLSAIALVRSLRRKA